MSTITIDSIIYIIWFIVGSGFILAVICTNCPLPKRFEKYRLNYKQNYRSNCTNRTNCIPTASMTSMTSTTYEVRNTQAYNDAQAYDEFELIELETDKEIVGDVV